jgi:hypothetical protein
MQPFQVEVPKRNPSWYKANWCHSFILCFLIPKSSKKETHNSALFNTKTPQIMNVARTWSIVYASVAMATQVRAAAVLGAASHPVQRPVRRRPRHGYGIVTSAVLLAVRNQTYQRTNHIYLLLSFPHENMLILIAHAIGPSRPVLLGVLNEMSATTAPSHQLISPSLPRPPSGTPSTSTCYVTKEQKCNCCTLTAGTFSYHGSVARQ